MRKLNRVVKISTQVVIPITAGQITRLKKTDAEFRKSYIQPAIYEGENCIN